MLAQKIFNQIDLCSCSYLFTVMNHVEDLVFRRLTDADFFNINKPPGIEFRGGGQSYIDINTSAVSLGNWRAFFTGVPEFNKTNGPGWTFEIHSLGVNNSIQELTIAQRRPASVSIRSQKLLSRRSNRVNAWKPDLTGFPTPVDPAKRSRIYDLHIYIAKLDNDEYWAGWFQTSKPEANWPINDTLNRMFKENEGYIKFTEPVGFDFNDPEWPFRV